MRPQAIIDGDHVLRMAESMRATGRILAFKVLPSSYVIQVSGWPDVTCDSAKSASNFLAALIADRAQASAATATEERPAVAQTEEQER